MVSLPFFHIAGIAILFRTFISGSACYLPDRNEKLQDQLSKTRVTHLSLVSTQLYRWIGEITTSDSVTSLKAILLGGSQISETLVQSALQANLPVHTSYGSTEMSSQITTTSDDDLKTNFLTSGSLLSHREMKIDGTGEILVRGKTLCKGYVSGKDLISSTDGEGWFHTGDLGSFDDNQNLIIKGRRDNMFISGGENIYPEEIEQQLQFHSHITGVCVVDIHEDEYGARPVAFIKLEGKKKINESQLKKYLEDKITSFKIPVKFFDWPEDMDELKPDRKYLRELAIKIMREK
jgi:O-succinylbenzoic acid--CoA ligase